MTDPSLSPDCECEFYAKLLCPNCAAIMEQPPLDDKDQLKLDL